MYASANADAVLDQRSEAWRGAVAQQITAFEDLIARARGAQTFLAHALACPKQHPMTQCPQMVSTLDQMVAGKTFEQLAAEHTVAQH